MCSSQMKYTMFLAKKRSTIRTCTSSSFKIITTYIMSRILIIMESTWRGLSHKKMDTKRSWHPLGSNWLKDPPQSNLNNNLSRIVQEVLRIQYWMCEFVGIWKAITHQMRKASIIHPLNLPPTWRRRVSWTQKFNPYLNGSNPRSIEKHRLWMILLVNPTTILTKLLMKSHFPQRRKRCLSTSKTSYFRIRLTKGKIYWCLWRRFQQKSRNYLKWKRISKTLAYTKKSTLKSLSMFL
jgi:hypothetical protein